MPVQTPIRQGLRRSEKDDRVAGPGRGGGTSPTGRYSSALDDGVARWRLRSSPGTHLEAYMLEGRSDLAALWDIRIQPDYRRRGIGSRLFRRAGEWGAGAKGSRQLKIETQNINVAACKFYARPGLLPRSHPPRHLREPARRGPVGLVHEPLNGVSCYPALSVDSLFSASARPRAA